MAEIQQTITPKEPKQPPKTVLDDEIGDFEPEQPELSGPSPIPEARPVEIPKNTPLNELMDILKKWLYIEEDYAITGPLCVAIANFCQGDTDIVGIVGPSGSIKTEVIRALGTTENEIVYPISSLTEHTFISGFSEKSDIDVVPNLRGRLITIKDLTTVLSKDDKVRSQIFADFRDLTDGYMDKKFGNGVHKTYTDIHSSVLFASTNAIEKYYSLHANLGQRMLFMRPRSDGDKAAAQADKNADKVDIMRKELNEAAGKFMEEMIRSVKTGLPFMFDDQREDMRKAYSFLAKVRTNISHGYGGVIDEIPEPEFPTRIAKSVNRLIQVHAFIYGRKIVTADDLAFGLRIVSDNVPTRRLLVLRNLDEKGLIRETIVGKTRLPPKAVDDILTDLIALELVDRGRSGHSKTNNFSISSKVVDAIQSITGVTPPISIWDDLSD